MSSVSPQHQDHGARQSGRHGQRHHESQDSEWSPPAPGVNSHVDVEHAQQHTDRREDRQSNVHESIVADPTSELADFLETLKGPSAISPQNPLSQQAAPSANRANPMMNPNNPGAFNNPANPQLNPDLPGSTTNPSNPAYNAQMPGAQNNPSNPQFNPSMPGATNNAANPALNPAFPGSITNPSNPIHNPDYPDPSKVGQPPTNLGPDASFPPRPLSAWRFAGQPIDQVLQEYEARRPPGGNWEGDEGGWTCDGGAAVLADMLSRAGVQNKLRCGQYWHPDTESRMRAMGGGPEDNEFLDEHHHWVETPTHLIDPNGENRGEPRIQTLEQAAGRYVPRDDPNGRGNREFMSYSPLWDEDQQYLHGVDTLPWAHHDSAVEQYRRDMGYRTSRMRRADNYTQDTREWADPTEPRASKPPMQMGCTCPEGHKLDCPIHGMDAENADADHTWFLPENTPVGYPQDQPRGWTDAVQSSKTAGHDWYNRYDGQGTPAQDSRTAAHPEALQGLSADSHDPRGHQGQAHHLWVLPHSAQRLTSANPEVDWVAQNYPQFQHVGYNANGHPQYVYSDPQGNGHLVTGWIGGGTKKRAVQDIAPNLKRQMYKCLNGACDHVFTEDPESYVAQPEPGNEPVVPRLNPGMQVSYEGQPHYITAADTIDGTHVYDLAHAQTGVPVEMVGHDELSPAPRTASESPFGVTLRTMRRDGYSEEDIEAWGDYLAAHNEADRDSGELHNVPDEQVERWYENWESEGRPRVSRWRPMAMNQIDPAANECTCHLGNPDSGQMPQTGERMCPQHGDGIQQAAWNLRPARPQQPLPAPNTIFAERPPLRMPTPTGEAWQGARPTRFGSAGVDEAYAEPSAVSYTAHADLVSRVELDGPAKHQVAAHAGDGGSDQLLAERMRLSAGTFDRRGSLGLSGGGGKIGHGLSVSHGADGEHVHAGWVPLGGQHHGVAAGGEPRTIEDVGDHVIGQHAIVGDVDEDDVSRDVRSLAVDGDLHTRTLAHNIPPNGTHQCPSCGLGVIDNGWTGWTPVSEGQFGQRSWQCPQCQVDWKAYGNQPLPVGHSGLAQEVQQPRLLQGSAPLLRAQGDGEQAAANLVDPHIDLGAGPMGHERQLLAGHSQQAWGGSRSIEQQSQKPAGASLKGGHDPASTDAVFVTPGDPFDVGHHVSSLSWRLAMPYHVAPTQRRQLIHEQGLSPDAPRINTESDHPRGVYVWDDPDVAWKYRGQGPNMYRDMDVWHVNTDGLDMQRDPWFDEHHQDRAQDFPGASYTTEPIEPERLSPHALNPWYRDQAEWEQPYWQESDRRLEEYEAQEAQRTSAHRLWWKPGQWGRGLVHNGDVYTWPQDEATHEDMARGLNIPFDYDSAFAIDPQGQFRTNAAHGDHLIPSIMGASNRLIPHPYYHSGWRDRNLRPGYQDWDRYEAEQAARKQDEKEWSYHDKAYDDMHGRTHEEDAAADQLGELAQNPLVEQDPTNEQHWRDWSQQPHEMERQQQAYQQAMGLDQPEDPWEDYQQDKWGSVASSGPPKAMGAVWRPATPGSQSYSHRRVREASVDGLLSPWRLAGSAGEGPVALPAAFPDGQRVGQVSGTPLEGHRRFAGHEGADIGLGGEHRLVVDQMEGDSFSPLLVSGGEAAARVHGSDAQGGHEVVWSLAHREGVAQRQTTADGHGEHKVFAGARQDAGLDGPVDVSLGGTDVRSGRGPTRQATFGVNAQDIVHEPRVAALDFSPQDRGDGQSAPSWYPVVMHPVHGPVIGERWGRHLDILNQASGWGDHAPMGRLHGDGRAEWYNGMPDERAQRLLEQRTGQQWQHEPMAWTAASQDWHALEPEVMARLKAANPYDRTYDCGQLGAAWYAVLQEHGVPVQMMMGRPDHDEDQEHVWLVVDGQPFDPAPHTNPGIDVAQPGEQTWAVDPEHEWPDVSPYRKQAAANLMYHVAPYDDHDKVMRHGIDWRKRDRSRDWREPGDEEFYPYANYLTTSLPHAREYAQASHGNIYGVDVTGMQPMTPDVDDDWGNTAWHTSEPIGPERVSLVEPHPQWNRYGRAQSKAQMFGSAQMPLDHLSTLPAHARSQAHGHVTVHAHTRPLGHPRSRPQQVDQRPDHNAVDLVHPATEKWPTLGSVIQGIEAVDQPAHRVADVADHIVVEPEQAVTATDEPWHMPATAAVPSVAHALEPAAEPWAQVVVAKDEGHQAGGHDGDGVHGAEHTAWASLTKPSVFGMRAPLFGHKRVQQTIGKSAGDLLYQTSDVNGSHVGASLPEAPCPTCGGQGILSQGPPVQYCQTCRGSGKFPRLEAIPPYGGNEGWSMPEDRHMPRDFKLPITDASDLGPRHFGSLSWSPMGAGPPSGSHLGATSWHLTDNPQFALDPNHVPQDNTFALQQRNRPGLYTGDPEHWFNGYDYVRPYAAEIEHPDAEKGRWGGEGFIPAEQFPQSRVKRVIPLDEYARETFGEPGWFEEHENPQKWDQPRTKYPNYRYQGPDVRDMPPEEHERQMERVNRYIQESRPHMLRRYDENGDPVEYGDPRWEKYAAEGLLPIRMHGGCPSCGGPHVDEETGECTDCGYAIPYDGAEQLEGFETMPPYMREGPGTVGEWDTTGLEPHWGRTAMWPMGSGDLYHVSPRANRESILQKGLIGHEDQSSSPWTYDWNGSEQQPKGNYVFSNPQDAHDYVYSLHGREGMGGFREPDFEDRYEWPEPPEDIHEWEPGDQDNWYDQNEPVERTDDPGGYDIWRVNGHGLPIGTDPESALTQQHGAESLTEQHGPRNWDLGQIHDLYQNAHEEWGGTADSLHGPVGGEAGSEPLRQYIPQHVPPHRLQLHEHVPSWNLTQQDRDNRLDERQEMPSVWNWAPYTALPMPGHESSWRLAETDSKAWEGKMYHGSPRGLLGPVRTPFWSTSHEPEALGFGEVVHPISVRFQKPMHLFGEDRRLLAPGSFDTMVDVARGAGHDGIVVHHPEDLRDPSDPYPKRTWAIALDPGSVVPGHDHEWPY